MTGQRSAGAPPAELLEPMRARISVDPLTGCWEWIGCVRSDGYGIYHFTANGTKQRSRAHRAVYEHLVGPIPDGLQLDHLCRVRHCVNPDHLEPVTGRVNILRGNTLPAVNAAKTHCVNGHPYAGQNLRTFGRKRYCRTCERERIQMIRERMRAG